MALAKLHERKSFVIARVQNIFCKKLAFHFYLNSSSQGFRIFENIHLSRRSPHHASSAKRAKISPFASLYSKICNRFNAKLFSKSHGVHKVSLSFKRNIWICNHSCSHKFLQSIHHNTYINCLVHDRFNIP